MSTFSENSKSHTIRDYKWKILRQFLRHILVKFWHFRIFMCRLLKRNRERIAELLRPSTRFTFFLPSTEEIYGKIPTKKIIQQIVINHFLEVQRFKIYKKTFMYLNLNSSSLSPPCDKHEEK